MQTRTPGNGIKMAKEYHDRKLRNGSGALGVKELVNGESELRTRQEATKISQREI
jgi:hypothetical protein